MTPLPGLCLTCGQFKLLTYIDRELEEMVCGECIEFVESADQVLSMTLKRAMI